VQSENTTSNKIILITLHLQYQNKQKFWRFILQFCFELIFVSYANTLYIKWRWRHFAIVLYGECCRRHLVGQRAANDISVMLKCL